MQRHKIGSIVGVIGICLLLFYLVVRLTFIDVLNAALAQAGIHSIKDMIMNLSVYLIIYLLWVYSFKLGMLLVILGAALKAGMGNRELWIFISGGVIYLVTCYLPFIGYSPPFYGILGTMILVLFLFIAWHWMKRRPSLARSAQIGSDLRMIGYYFLVMATWTLCGIFGIVTYALKPEIMIERGLQSTTIMLTSHVIIELSLGWLFIFLSVRKENSSS
jgi:hypothetical protein